MYVIKRLKAFYPAFRNHLEKLEKEEKRYLLEEYERAFKHLTFFDVQEKTSAAIQASTNRAPSVKDILETSVKRFNDNPSKQAVVSKDLDRQYAAALNTRDWREMQRIGTLMSNDYATQLGRI